MIKVLIIEDDPMVAEFNKRFLSIVEGFSLVGISHSVEDAIRVLETNHVDLILLDVYMPGDNGLEFLSSVREKGQALDVIMITAASEGDVIQSALHLGAIDYLIKPFEFERFKQALIRYKERFDLFRQKESLNQKILDQQLFRPDNSKQLSDYKKALPKGVTKNTLLAILENIQEMKTFTTDELADRTSISRVSVRKYLLFLTEMKVLEETLTYGIGRPVYHYSYRGNDEVLNKYLS